MTDSVSTSPASSQRLKVTLHLVIIIFLIWGGAIGYWRATDSVPGTTGLVSTLLILRVVAFGAIRGAAAFRARRASANPNVTAFSATTAAVDHEGRAAQIAIIAATLRLPHGSSADEVAEAIARVKTRPDLDGHLLDADGFRVMSQRISDDDTETLQEEICIWLAGKSITEPRFSEGQWRAVAHATDVTRALAAQALRNMVTGDGTRLALRVIPLLPSDWGPDQRNVASQWLMQVASQTGWPMSHIVLDEQAIHPTEPVFSSAITQLTRQGASSLALIIACGSYIAQQSVDQWAANRMLFTADNPRGLIPGEGAAGLLLATLERTDLTDKLPSARLHFAEQTIRGETSSRGRSDSLPVLNNLAERVAKDTGTLLSDVGKIVADTSSEPSRVMEVMHLANTITPQLDTSTDIVYAGSACGTCDDVPLIAALSLAYHFAAERQEPVVCVGNNHPVRRCIALIWPAETVIA